MIVVAVIGLLATIAIPSMMSARRRTQENACVSNLRAIDGAKEQWAFAAFAPMDATPTWPDLADYIKGGTRKCFCAADPTRSCSNSYSINPLSGPPTCKIDSDHVY